HHLPQNLNHSVNPEHQKVFQSLLCDLVELVWCIDMHEDKIIKYEPEISVINYHVKPVDM
ncbi:hypothetical protein L9F63_004225, partial [Diploptera punctata]